MTDDAKNGDTDQSELAPGDRDTLPPQTIEAQLADLQAALAESNALAILSRNASERCTDVSMRLLQRLRDDELRAADLTKRVARVEEYVGLAAE